MAGEVFAAARGGGARDTSRARILVFDTSGNGGYADRLTGLMTALLLAVLSGRALASIGRGTSLRCRHRTSRREPTRCSSVRRAPRRLAEVRRLSWLNANRKSVAASMTSNRSTSLWPERVVVLKSNRGFTQQLLAAPVHEAAVTRWGLTARKCPVRLPAELPLPRRQPAALVAAHPLSLTHLPTPI